MFLEFHEIESFFKQQIMILPITQEKFVQVKFFCNYRRPDYLTSELFVEPCEKSWYNCSATGTSSFPSTVSQMKRAPTQRRLSTFDIIIISFLHLIFSIIIWANLALCISPFDQALSSLFLYHFLRRLSTAEAKPTQLAFMQRSTFSCKN